VTRALVVDDEPDERALLATHLRRAGCEVVEAVDAERALETDLSTVDVAFVDLRLPGIDGWELIEVLRERRPGLPVVVTSVLDAVDYPRAEAVVTKPFSRVDVEAALRTALGDEGGEP